MDKEEANLMELAKQEEGEMIKGEEEEEQRRTKRKLCFLKKYFSAGKMFFL